MAVSSLEFRRQAFHAMLGIVIVLLVLVGFLTAKRLLLMVIMGAVISGISVKCRIPLISWFLDNFDRKDEKIPGKGAIFYILGCLIVLALFPQRIALASILVMALGDSFATIVGFHFGKIKSITRKTLEGFFAGSFAGFIGAVLFVDYFSALAGSLAAMFFEMLEIRLGSKVIDDNIMVPLTAALVMWIIVLL